MGMDPQNGTAEAPSPAAEAGWREILARNLTSLKERIAAACTRAGRGPGEVTLVAVTKTAPPVAVRLLAELGQRVFGENRVQEAIAKIPQSPPGLQWHLIGNLQRNKAARAVQWFNVVHAVDGLELADSLERHAGAAGRSLPCFLEVNVSGEASKHGLTPDAALALAPVLVERSHARLSGLMTMAPLAADPEQSRPYFRALRALRDRINRVLPAARALTELSMGMSQDYAVAVEEGATFVRLGTVLFQDTSGLVGTYRAAGNAGHRSTES